MSMGEMIDERSRLASAHGVSLTRVALRPEAAAPVLPRQSSQSET